MGNEKLSFKQLQIECKKRGLKPCSGRGVTREFLLRLMNAKHVTLAAPNSLIELLETRSKNALRIFSRALRVKKKPSKIRDALLAADEILLTDMCMKDEALCFDSVLWELMMKENFPILYEEFLPVVGPYVRSESPDGS